MTPPPAEPSSYGLTRSVFLRGLALVYLIAFASLLPQITGLIGSRGILPAQTYLESMQAEYGARAYLIVPTIAWFNASDFFLRAVPWIGVAMAVMLLCRILPMFALLGLYILYLSVDTIGQTFFSFQWDSLLLETGFAAILVAPFGIRPVYAKPTHPIGIWVLRALVFRLMLESGLAKLLSGDPTWRNLSALTFHFETQPLPTPLAWYVHHIPELFHKIAVVSLLLIEIVIPFLFWMGRRLRITGAWLTIALQLLIALTGNYTFFNLLSIVLCIPLFDDQHLAWILRKRVENSELPHPYWRSATIPVAVLLISMGMIQLLAVVGALPMVPRPLNAMGSQAETFRIINRYGLFAVMTTSRPEIIVEGSEDGQSWKSYEFKYKPGELNRPLRWVVPYQPRLDWQMWFAALSTYRDAPWFSPFVRQLLEGSPDVLHLLEINPFPGKPPRFIRARIYDYHFSDLQTRRSTGAVWTRQYLGEYFPQVSLRQ
jgi:lipase maturation factor 1